MSKSADAAIEFERIPLCEHRYTNEHVLVGGGWCDGPHPKPLPAVTITPDLRAALLWALAISRFSRAPSPTHERALMKVLRDADG